LLSLWVALDLLLESGVHVIQQWLERIQQLLGNFTSSLIFSAAGIYVGLVASSTA